MMPTVETFMTRTPFFVTSNDTIERARGLMNEHAIRHVPVVDGGDLVGMVVDRELVVLETIPGLKPSLVSITKAMRPALSVSANLGLDDAVDLMVDNELDCLVVRDPAGHMEGIVTAVDALAAIASLAR